jgi:hypothetical protein
MILAVLCGPSAAQIKPAPQRIRTPRAVGPAPIPAIRIDPKRELAITDLSVVEDAVLTDASQPCGEWTFRFLIENMAGANDPSTFVLRWLETWERDQQINGFTALARPSIRQLILDPWLQASGGRRLDLSKAPFRLLAIVNRLDLRSASGYSVGNAGEGRFVFGVIDAGGNALPFTVIFEYGLPATSQRELLGWARSWHRLGSVPFGPRYNRLLRLVTRRFTRKNAAPNKPNGNAINQIRTNEIALSGPWELREFVIGSRCGLLQPTTVKQTPDLADLNNTRELAALINRNERAILAGTFVVPAKLLSGTAPVQGVWNAAGINDLEARHRFAVNTCNGCHGQETATSFLHVGTRAFGQESILSAFMTGGSATDPVSGKQRSFNDLARRARDLRTLLTTRVPSPTLAASAADSARVH